MTPTIVSSILNCLASCIYIYKNEYKCPFVELQRKSSISANPYISKKLSLKCPKDIQHAALRFEDRPLYIYCCDTASTVLGRKNCKERWVAYGCVHGGLYISFSFSDVRDLFVKFRVYLKIFVAHSVLMMIIMLYF